jgi:tetratricopeptide (TPR) repeat protein
LKKLADALCSPRLSGEGPGARSAVITQAITGMGGLGKTQLAVEFAYRYGNQFQGVHWLNLADPTTLDSEIASCGQKMGFDNWPDDQPSQVALTEREWKSQGPRLLILDNFEDVAHANNILPRFRHSSIRILVTSRRSDWLPTTGLNPILLELFSPKESLDFLKRSLQKRKDSDDDLNTLSERLGHLPLALELASRYLNGHTRLSVTDYLAQTKQALEHASMNAWKKEVLGLTPTQHDTSLLSTFALSWLAINAHAAVPGGEDAAGSKMVAQKMFQSVGYLAPNTAIPLEIFEKTLKISSEQCDEALTLLYGLGLLRESESQPTIHPLLAEYARGLSREDIKILEALADTLATLSKEAVETGLPARFDSIKPHVPVLALYAENEKNENTGVLWNNYGYHLKMIADYSGARAVYEHALKIDPDDSTYINNLGGVMRAQGDLDGARAAYERALKIFEASLGKDHPNVATLVNNLGNVMQDQGDLVGARTAFERAMKMGEDSLGSDHPSVAIRVNNLGGVMREQGDLVGARAAYERALKIFETTLGAEHPQVAIGVINLGSVMQAQGDFVGARAAFERALKISEKSFGSEHPDTVQSLWWLGVLEKEDGNKDTARKYFERTLQIFQKLLPPDHPRIKNVQGWLDSLDK